MTDSTGSRGPVVSRRVVIGLVVGALLVAGGAITVYVTDRDDPSPRRDDARVFRPPSSIPADCSRPVEKELQAFIDSVPDDARIEFAPGACYAQDWELQVNDRQNLVLDGRGARFRLVTQGPPDHCRANWRIQGGSGVHFSNMAAEGIHTTSLSDPRVPIIQQCQHGWAVDSLQGGTFRDLHGLNNAGDALTLGPDRRGIFGDYCLAATPRDILVDNLLSENSGRVGLAITMGENVVVQHTRFVTPYDQNMDIETDVACQLTRDIGVYNNLFGPSNNGAFVFTGGNPAENASNLELSGSRMHENPLNCIMPVYHYPGIGIPYGGGPRSMYIHDNDLRALGHGMLLVNMNGRVEENRVHTGYGSGCLDATGKKAVVKFSGTSAANVSGNVGTVGGGGVPFTEEWYSEGNDSRITTDPPRPPEIQGKTVLAGSKTGPPGGAITARATGGVPGLPYRLVLARDDCKNVASVLDIRALVADEDGTVSPATGRISSTLEPGRYEVCLRNLTDGRLVRATAPALFTVTERED